MEKDVSRRMFLTGAAVTGVGVATGLIGCAPTGGMEAANGATSGAVALTAESSDAPWAFEIPPEPVPDSAISETIVHDIVIVGSGMGGLCTAVSAAEQGSDVVLFSASSKAISRGGSNHGFGTEHQKALGIDYTPESARGTVKLEQIAGSFFVDKKKWARWIDNSAESMNWTIGHMTSKGVKVSMEPGYHDPDGVLTSPPTSHNFWNAEVPLGPVFGAPLEVQTWAKIFVDDLGKKIDYNVVAKYLIREGGNTGRVSAVVAQREDGSYVKYEATKAVVLATGDFSKNPDMMAKYSPWTWENFKDTLSTGEMSYSAESSFTGLMPGDGQRMGLWIGAAWQKTFPAAPMINIMAGWPQYGRSNNFWGLNMDIHGERYMNECTNFAYAAVAMQQLPQHTAFGVWDSAYAKTADEWDQWGVMVERDNGILPLSPDKVLASWDKAVESGALVKSDTIEGLVAKLDGIDGGTALKTIKRYTQYAEQGLDEEFHVNPSVLHPISKPPFYGAKVAGASFLTICGGLRTDEHMRVCDKDDVPIEGLYNTGIMTGDFYANTYNFSMFGQNLGGVCGTLSYLLGRELAEL